MTGRPSPSTTSLDVRRLRAGDRDLARRLFAVLAETFGEATESLSEAYIDKLLCSDAFWAIAAIEHADVVGGLTAHTLPMTKSESAELFIYDVAVRVDRQRQGVGRRLVAALLDAATDAGIDVAFVPVDNADAHALDFYRASGGEDAPVTIFSFRTRNA